MVRLIADSTADLTAKMKEEFRVKVMPLSVHFGDESFLDGVTITNEEFYDRLVRADASPTTSQINPAEFEEEFEAVKEAGDEAVCMVLSSKLSGTYQSAMIARDMVGYDKIYVVDLNSVTLGSALLVSQAAKLRDEGKSGREIKEALDEMKNRVEVCASVDTLKYLKMGGRISAATAFVGGVLGVLPLVGVVDGKVESIGKVKGKAAAAKFLTDRIQGGEIDFSMPVCVAHIKNPAGLEALKECFAKIAPETPCYQVEIGSVVGTYAGPGALGISYFKK